MKKRLIAALGTVMLLAGVFVLRAKEPTVMTVNGRDVPLSEFQYLYLKNQQQTQLQPIDEYVEIFKLYKLKVADALAMGLDTTKAFRDEYEQYRNELAQPYLADSAYTAQLVDEAYRFYGIQVHPCHIMLTKTPDGAENRVLVNRLDSIRGLIVSGKMTFADAARQFSDDRSSRNDGGDLGWTNNPQYPYAFLRTLYTLQPGEVSEVVESPVAFHLIKVADRHPHTGYLSASHIMKRFAPNASDEERMKAKEQIDSIYAAILATPDKFEEMAVRFSDDKGSSQRGGKLDPFPQGAYPQPFDSIAFALKDNEISKPLMTDFGWHIIKRFGTRPLETKAKMRDRLTAIVTNPRDVRAEMISGRQLQNIGKEFGLKPNKKSLQAIDAYIVGHGMDSLFYQNMSRQLGKAPLRTFKGGSVTLADMAQQLNKLVNLDPQFARQEFNRRLDNVTLHKLMPLKEASLASANPDYRNLLNEFRDGSLLYEAGRQRVWDRAANDTAGLQQYFQLHQGDYSWQKPRAKGYLIQTVNDSTAALIKARMAQLQPSEYVSTLRKEFGRDIQIDRVLAPKGVSSQVDFLAFDGPEAKPSDTRFHTFWMADMKVLDTPEELSDVRGLVIADYQNYLMQQWEDELREKYPVTVNKAVLSKVRTK